MNDLMRVADDGQVEHFHEEQKKGRGFSIETIINMWLKAVSRSEKTWRAYAETIQRFRDYCKFVQKDLIYHEENMSVEIADLAMIFSRLRFDGKPGEASPATQAQRCAALSSFYTYAIQQRHIPDAVNPMDLVKRPRVDAYAGAQAIPPEEIRARVARIDTSTKQGAQDEAIIWVLLTTGRRASEVAGLRAKDVGFLNDRIVLHFEHMKNDKSIDDLLEPYVSAAVLTSVERIYGVPLRDLTGDMPLFVDCYHGLLTPLGYQGIAGVCRRWLGTTKVHTTRGTFAVAMEEAGATISVIQNRLAQSNPATTGIYLNKLKRKENAYSSKLVQMFGMDNSENQK